MNGITFHPGAIDAGGAVSNAWEQVKSNYGLYLGMALLGMVMAGCVPCISLFLVGPTMGGIYFVALRGMRNEPVEFGMMFKGFEKFVPLMVIGLIQSIPGIIAQIFRLTINLGQLGLDGSRQGRYEYFQSGESALAGVFLIVALVGGLIFIIIGFAFWSLSFFAVPLVMEHDLGVVDAFKLSARAAMQNIGGMIVYFIFMILIILLGVVLICVGMFLISLPVIYVANAFIYRQVFPMMEQRFQNMAPPPPTAYGFGN